MSLAVVQFSGSNKFTFLSNYAHLLPFLIHDMSFVESCKLFLTDVYLVPPLEVIPLEFHQDL